eukprot:TRINITY_DN14750_c0_g1_i1.p1 TRINITY_DN14750_c0_g1~~TRINITY_DN14750_c0_g1_i1.p1  ORF type:complete len:924 (+),score=187.45 TRINITY_DN14750_c0_g1_i1:27-2798(+)
MFQYFGIYRTNTEPTSITLRNSKDSVPINAVAASHSPVLAKVIKSCIDYYEVPDDTFPNVVLIGIQEYLEHKASGYVPTVYPYFLQEKAKILQEGCLLKFVLAATHLGLDTLLDNLYNFISGTLFDSSNPEKARQIFQLKDDLPSDQKHQTWWDEREDFQARDFSTSYYLDYGKRDRLTNEAVEVSPALDFLRPRRPTFFIPDEHANTCSKCNQIFTTIIRRHHCRICGRVFCHACSCKELVVPSDFQIKGQTSNFLSRMFTATRWSPSVNTSQQTIPRQASVPHLSTQTYTYTNSNPTNANPNPYDINAAATPPAAPDSPGQSVTTTTTTVRVCLDCFQDLAENVDAERVSELSTGIRAFELLSFPMRVLYRAATLNSSWRRAVSFLLSVLRELQYSLPTHAFTDRERRLLCIDRERWSGHSLWTVQFLKSVDWSDPSYTKAAREILGAKQVSSCMSTLCSGLCTENLETKQAIELLGSTITDDFVREYAVGILETADPQELTCIAPLLVNQLENERNPLKSKLAQMLINKALEDKVFRNDLYWVLNVAICHKNQRYLKVFLELLMIEIATTLGREEAMNITRGQELVNLFDLAINFSYDVKEARNKIETQLQELMNEGPIRLPVLPKIQATSFSIESLTFKSSSTRPFTIKGMCQPSDPPFSTTTTMESLKSQPETPFHLLFKNEDIRKDYVVMSIIQLMKIILKREPGMEELDIVTYRVMPTSESRGLIEMVSNVRTLGSVIRTEGITNYFGTENNDIWRVWRVFAKSTAAYMIITYLLGVGDRHTDNVLLRSDGVLFHIDYGFVMGEDPHPLMPRVLFKRELIEAMGGESSSQYKDCFSDFYPKIFLILRRHVNQFASLLRLLPFEPSDLEEHIKDRFLPGLSDVDASRILIERMDRSLDSVPVKIWDTFRSLRTQLGK